MCLTFFPWDLVVVVIYVSLHLHLLAGLHEVVNIADDILIYGTRPAEHDTNVINFLKDLQTLTFIRTV